MREEVAALVFGPGLPPGGARGTLTVSSLGVEVAADDRSQRADVASISLRKVGFESAGVEFSWHDGGDAWAAHVLDPDVAKRLLTLPVLAATTQAQQLKSARRRVKVGRGIGLSVLGLLVLLPVLLLLLLVLNANTIAGWIADKIPVHQEMEFGRQAFAGMRGNLKLKDEGAAYDAVQSIVAKLTQGSQYKYEVHVSEDQTLNAFAMPGGIIVVNTGLIEATKRPEELAGVLAHEVQHVELRHSIRGMVKDLGLRGMWAAATGDLGGTLVGEAALQLTTLKFSRDDETEADHKGFEALLAAGIDPSGMPAFFKIMSEKAVDAPVALISTHPLSKERERDLQERVEQLDRRDFSPLEFGGWPPE